MFTSHSVTLPTPSSTTGLFRSVSLKIWILALTALLLTGCGTVRYDNVKLKGGSAVATQLTSQEKASIKGLTQELISLSPSISPQEAALVAYEAHTYSMILANKYNLTYPPLYHNMLVNAKKRDRGLCYQWAHDLTAHLRSKNLKSFDLHWAVAFRRNYWREHNTLVISAKGKKIPDGIVLDPWRDSGRLFWKRVPADKKYPWVKFVD